MLAIAFLLFAVFSSPAFTASIGDPCKTASECAPKNSMCKIVSPSCGGGTCECIPGFSDNSDGTACLRNVEYGQRCQSSDDICLTQGAQCVDGLCACPEGFVTGPGNAKTVCTLAGGIHGNGDSCSSDDDCFADNSYCDTSSKKCVCLNGYKATDAYSCNPNRYGDSCATDSDCSLLQNMQCKSGKCDCVLGANPSPVMLSRMDYLVKKKTVFEQAIVCYKGTSAQKEGQVCNYGSSTTGGGSNNYNYYPSDATTDANYDYSYRRKKRQADSGNSDSTNLYCAAPFNCIYCSSALSICARTVYMVSASSVGSTFSPNWIHLFLAVVIPFNLIKQKIA